MSDPIPIPRRPAEGANRLESWKEIAAYLRREARTVQGWEKNEGLPVHRHQHGKQGSVYAFRTELDTWREARKGVPEAAPVAEGPAPADEPQPPAWKRRSTLLVIVCAAIVIMASVFLWRNRTASSSGRELSSVVVLPFLDMSPQKDQEYFSDGLTEEIIDALSRVPNLRVVARTSAFAFKGKANDVRQIGRQLNVEAMLEGSVRKAGDDLRITAQLNRVSDGTHLWSRTYDRKLRDVFAVQQEISQSIANQLRAGNVPPALPARNLEAYARYQEGLYFFNQHQIPDSYWKALERYQQAIRLDPEFARAYAAMAEAYAYLAENFAVWPKEVFPKAKEAAEKAVALDDNLAEAHTSRGVVKLDYEWDREGAWREFQRALELDLGSGWVHHWVAHALETQGKLDEAMKEMRAALALDPLSIPIHWDIANELLSAGRFDEAVKFLDHAEELFPGYPIIEWQRADAAYRKGDRQAAIRIAETLLTQNPELKNVPAMLSLKGVVAEWAGRRTEAQQILAQIEEMRKKQYVDAFTILELCSAMGDHEKLMLWTRRAYEDRSTTFFYLPMTAYIYDHDTGVTAFLAKALPKPGS